MTIPRQVSFVPNNQLDHRPIRCYICNRLGHIAKNCFANNSYRPNLRGIRKHLSRGTNYSGYATRGNRGNTFLTKGNYQNPNFQPNTYQYCGRTNQPNRSWNWNTRGNYTSRQQQYNNSTSNNNQGNQSRTYESSTPNIWEPKGNYTRLQNS